MRQCVVISQWLKLSLALAVKAVEVEGKALGVEVAGVFCYYDNKSEYVDCGVSLFLRMILQSKHGEGEQLKIEDVQMEMQ